MRAAPPASIVRVSQRACVAGPTLPATWWADLSVNALNVIVAFVQPPVGSVGAPITNRL